MVNENKCFLSNLKIASDTPYVYLTVRIDRGILIVIYLKEF